MPTFGTRLTSSSRITNTCSETFTALSCLISGGGAAGCAVAPIAARAASAVAASKRRPGTFIVALPSKARASLALAVASVSAHVLRAERFRFAAPRVAALADYLRLKARHELMFAVTDQVVAAHALQRHAQH